MKTRSVLRKLLLPLQCNSLRVLLLPVLLASGALSAQTPVNAYARVTDISADKMQLTLSNVDQTYHSFVAGEQVIVMQMQDNVIGSNTSNNTNFGRLSSIESAGLFDVGTIGSVTASKITLTSPLYNDYHTGSHSRVQVISFTKPAAGDFTTTSAVTALPWNGNTGGVLALQVAGTLTLAHSIDADGGGFRGGEVSDDYENGCEPSVYTSSSDRYGGKGEGIYRSTSNSYISGRAHILTGGGGGNDDNAGGGGGGNFTAGGQGGAGWTCSTTPAGGLGGIELKSYSNGLRVFMGGGGGGGQQNNGYGSPGGDGGGIVIIRANRLATSGALPIRISANGIAPPDTGGGGNDGAGGGGAGGTVILDIINYTVPAGSPLQVLANGGNGANVNHSSAHGGGGGGAQGAIIHSVSLPGTNVVSSTMNGIGGLNNIGGTRAESAAGANNEGVLTGINVILPVEALSFSAEKKGAATQLSWNCTGEYTGSYDIQHSTDGTLFHTLAHIPGACNTLSGTHLFLYMHRTPSPGRNYYRLKINRDAPQSYKLSAVVCVTHEQAEGPLGIFPNPAHGDFLVSVPLLRSPLLTVTIKDLTGRVLFIRKDIPAQNTIGVSPGRGLRPGVYMLTVSGGGQSHSGKLIIR